MTRDNVAVRPATRADLDAWYGGLWNRTCRAWVVAVGGEDVALAGYSHEDGYIMCFSDIRDIERFPKTMIWRHAVRVFEKIKSYGLPLYALAHPEYPGAGRFLERLGFEHEDGGIYKWRH